MTLREATPAEEMKLLKSHTLVPHGDMPLVGKLLELLKFAIEMEAKAACAGEGHTMRVAQLIRNSAETALFGVTELREDDRRQRQEAFEKLRESGAVAAEEEE